MRLTEKSTEVCGHVVLAHSESSYAEVSTRQFRCLGWEVHAATSGAEARHLARALMPDVVVLDADLSGESGWLTCAKLTREQPAQRVILVDTHPTPERAQFASFVGAEALVGSEDGVPALVEEVLGIRQLSLPA